MPIQRQPVRYQKGTLYPPCPYIFFHCLINVTYIDLLPSTILKVQHSNLELKLDIDSRFGILTCPDISRRWSCCKSSDRRMNKFFTFSVSSHDAKDICVIVNVFSYVFLFFQNLCSLSIKSIQCAFSSKSIQCATQEVHNMEGCLFIKKVYYQQRI